MNTEQFAHLRQRVADVKEYLAVHPTLVYPIEGAAKDLAEWFEQEHPVDGDEPITEDWLLSLGFREADLNEHKPDMRKRQWYRQFSMVIPGHQFLRAICWRYDKGVNAKIDAIAINSSTYNGGSFRWPSDQMNTRRDMLRLIGMLAGDGFAQRMMQWVQDERAKEAAASASKQAEPKNIQRTLEEVETP